MLISQVHLEPNCHASLLLCTFSLHLPSISYVQSSGQLSLWTQLSSTHACNHMNAKKGIQLLLILAIHCHTTESVEFLVRLTNNSKAFLDSSLKYDEMQQNVTGIMANTREQKLYDVHCPAHLSQAHNFHTPRILNFYNWIPYRVFITPSQTYLFQ